MAPSDSLHDYREKRDFRSSPEPGEDDGSGGTADAPVFVIQKHDASSLHYDLRLEVGGVLKSWAVPKGPSTAPSEKRLAQPTEDHPMSYADFEGIIPEGQYGAGTVIVWDTGTYRNVREEEGTTMEEALDDGKVKVWLEGEKLRGGYALVRTGSGERWLLIKMNDEEADARRNPVSTEPHSVLTGRTLDDLRGEEENE